MTGNSFGRIFRVTTFGESHGKAVGVVVDGCPPNMELSEKDIQKELDRRKPGQSRITTQRMENDKVEILSGVFEGKTLGTPVAMLVHNKNAKSHDYAEIKNLFRPGHADHTYAAKYGTRDWRGGGRASGRETVGRVAAGAIAKKILFQEGIDVLGYTKELHGIKAEKQDFSEIEKNSLRCPDREAAKRMEKEILKAKSEGDSVGGIVEIIAKGVPAGLGSPVFNKLDAEIARALMSIGAVKGVEIGAGFEAAKKRGSENNDELYFDDGIKHRTNNSGGIIGGISNGSEIVARIAVKPTPSISKEQDTVDIEGKESRIAVKGRHDPCICPRIVPVAEAMLAIILADALLRQKAVK